MTFGEIEAKVRTLVNDTETPYRFTSKQIQGFTIDAVRHLRTVNPSERYGANGLLDDSIPTPASGTEIRFDPRHEEAVVKYVAYKVYELDMTDTANLQIAENLKARAESLMLI